MKITERVTRTEEVVEVKDVICNRCGETCHDSSRHNLEGLIEAEVCGGYESKLGDSTSWQFSLCERCLKWLFETFKHPPAVKNSNFGPLEYVQPKDASDLDRILRGEPEYKC